MSGDKSILNRLHKFLYSTKLTLYTLFGLTAASILGSVTSKSNLSELPENLTAAEKIFKTYDLFHSWWFIAGVTLFCINLILCIIHHFVPQVKKYFTDEIFNKSSVENPWISERIEFAGGDKETASAGVSDYLKKRGFKEHEAGEWTVFEKGRFSRLLPFIFHFGLLVVILGGLYGSVAGFVGTTNIHVETEGDGFYNWTDLKEDKLGFTLRVDDFLVEYYPASLTVAVADKRTAGKVDLYEVKEREVFELKGTPYSIAIIEAVLDKRYTSANFYFRLFNAGNLVGDFYDNQDVEGFPYLLYYPLQLRLGIKKKGAQADLYTEEIAVGQSFNIKGTGYRVQTTFFDLKEGSASVLGFTLFDGEVRVGDFSSDKPLPNFPYAFTLWAVKFPEVGERIPKRLMTKVTIIKDGVVQTESEIEVNHPFTYEDKTFFLTSFDRDSFGFLFIGLQIVSDPGITIVYTGFAMMFLSVSFIFFVSHKKIYITCDNNYIDFVGEATKDKSGFRIEFNNYIDELKRT